MRIIKLGLVQMDCSASKPINMAKAIERIRQAAQKGAQVIVLQELFASLYFCDQENYENFSLAEKVPGPSTDEFSSLALELKVVIIASLMKSEAKDFIIIRLPL